LSPYQQQPPLVNQTVDRLKQRPPLPLRLLSDISINEHVDAENVGRSYTLNQYLSLIKDQEVDTPLVENFLYPPTHYLWRGLRENTL